MNIITGNIKITNEDTRENVVLERHKHAELDVEIHLSSTRTNCEQITLVWLDSHIIDNGSFADDICLTEEILRELNDYVVLFDNESECLAYISSIKNETVLLIVSGLCATLNLLSALHKLRHVDSIFIFCQNKNNYEKLKKDYCKIIGIFNEQRSLALSIKNAIEIVDKQSTIFALYDTDKQKSMRDLSRESGSFIFLQLFKQAMKQMAMNNGSTNESKHEMIDRCRMYYRGNEKEIKNIAEFEKGYTPNQAIRWYTRDSFIYKLINKALRTDDIDSLYNYRFYIVDLSKCLAESIGHHIAVNTFFSTSRQISVAEVSFQDEDEVIFDLGTVFKIESFQCKGENRYWICRMKASDEGQVIAQEYLDFKQAELNKSSDIEIILGDLLHDMGEWLKSHIYFEQLAVRRINDPQVHFAIARSHDALNRSDHALSHLKQAYILAMESDTKCFALAAKICYYSSRVYYTCNNFADALVFNKKALELYRRAGANDNQAGIAHALRGAGLIYFLKCEHEASLEHFQQALQLFQDVYPFDHPDKSTALSSLSYSYYLIGEYERALQYMLDGTAIHERLLPKDHPQLAVDFTCVGKLLYKQGKYDAALQRFYYATDLYDRRIMEINRTYAVILNNIGKALYRLNKLDEACAYYRKALEFIEKLFLTTSPDHADLAYTWKNMGELYMARCDAAGALELFERARDMYKRLFTLDGDHRDIAKCWHLIGQTHATLGNNTKASEAFETALRMWTNKLPKHHPDILLCHQSMGAFYADQRHNQ
ncbi:unnamed protein product [Rotaria magnacalcarata]|uniref:Uncharacterized protein n=1 Tax=Rotaria magnacalcarata TaxID=392030 RepID=A0A817AD23_9BILA|nr:unnamed protein product [Rotaria magnacalcarata]CAF4044859.1 unnamed protein product [Rotaria magnacalcarata]